MLNTLPVEEKKASFAAKTFISVLHMFEEQVRQSPNAIALVSTVRTLTYQQLNHEANQLARYLQNQGVGPEQLVAVQLARSPYAIIAFLSVLKLGAAYVPIDPDYPAERCDYILQDSQAAALLTESSYINHIADANYSGICIQLDIQWNAIAHSSSSNLSITVRPEDLAYVIYTSGTTGQPKGVAIPHRGLANHAITMATAFELTPADRVLQFSSLSFDIIVEELYPTIISGAALILRTDAIATSLTDFYQFLDDQKITVLNLPTAFWHELVSGLSRQAGSSKYSLLKSCVRLVVVGGEKASRLAYAQWCGLVGQSIRWINAYGPTEATVSATLYDPIAENYEFGKELPIGRPIDNVTTYVLNEALEQVKPGNQGELFIGGLGLARGYLNRPIKTAAAFIQNPFEANSRLYKTGDIVRQLADGNLEYVDRADFQVKVRGFRIELSGIASCLEKHPLVQQQIVVVRKDNPGTKQIVAYVVAKSPQLTGKILREYLKEKLPIYMVPSAFVLLDHLPTNTHGKIDRNALPAPQVQRNGYAAPKTDIEQTLINLWKTVLSIKYVSAQDNFFELGGNSLKAVHLFSLIEDKLNQKIPLAALLQAPTPARLAALIDQPHEPSQPIDSENLVLAHPNPNTKTASLWDSLVPLQPEGTKPPLFFLHAVGPSILNYQNLLPYLDSDQPVYALQAKGLDETQPLLDRMDKMAAQYIQDIKAVQPHGPYYLAGHSFGGIMAFEMAQQLQQQGENVGLLGLFDAATPALSYCQTPPIVYQLYIHALNLIEAPGLSQKWRYLSERAIPLLRKIFSRSKSTPVQPLPEIYQRIDQIDRAALRRYSPQPYSGVITLFRAREKDPKQFYDAHLGWKYLAEGSLSIHDVPGHHLSLMQEPNVAALATTLQHELNNTYAKEVLDTST